MFKQQCYLAMVLHQQKHKFKFSFQTSNFYQTIKNCNCKFANIYIQIENWKEISVTVSIQTLQQHIKTAVNTWVNLYKSDSYVCISKLAQSEKNERVQEPC